MQKRGKPSWDWMQVDGILKTTESNRKSVTWQLTPSIVLTNPTSNYTEPFVKVYIDTEKSLQYSSELGWNWHKSWNLPNISIRLEVKDQITNQQLLSPKNLYAQIFAVKKAVDNLEKCDKPVYCDVGIRGESKMQMIDGQVYFNGMKFLSTTYNNQGMNFSLLIAIYITEEQTEKPKILTAVISPPIFVDSRRSARDYLQKKFNSFIEPFTLDQLDKQFIKRENKSKSESQIVIKNDPEGFYNYLTAPNIRHKVKHPIFLAIKFSFCVKIYYNAKLFQEPLSDILENLQRKLLKESKHKDNRAEVKQNDINQMSFLILADNIQDSLKKKKVMESIDPIENGLISTVYNKNDIPSHFEDISTKGNLVKTYRDVYSLLVNICKSFEPSESESGYESNDEQDGKSSKKVKVDEKSETQIKKQKQMVKGPIQAQLLNLPKQQFQKEDKNHNHINIINKNGRSAFNNIHSEKQSQDYNNKPLQNLLYSNAVLSNWLSTVKSNNLNLYDAMMTPDQMLGLMRQPDSIPCFQDQQSLYCLMQQINLYRQLLSQVSYQNQLLGRNIGVTQNGSIPIGNIIGNTQPITGLPTIGLMANSNLLGGMQTGLMTNPPNLLGGFMGNFNPNIMGNYGILPQNQQKTEGSFHQQRINQINQQIDQMNQMNQMNQFNQINQLNQLNQMNQLHQMNQFSKMNPVVQPMNHIMHMNQINQINQITQPNASSSLHQSQINQGQSQYTSSVKYSKQKLSKQEDKSQKND